MACKAPNRWHFDPPEFSPLNAAHRNIEPQPRKAIAMLYAILAYHVEGEITALTPEEDAALMANLLEINARLTQEGRLGPAARLDYTATACTLRGPGAGKVIDGPFAETKEQLLGLYLINCESRDEAIAAARDLRKVNQTAVYEIRPVMRYLPGAALPDSTASSLDG
jgi:hypothetical protein